MFFCVIYVRLMNSSIIKALCHFYVGVICKLHILLIKAVHLYVVCTVTLVSSVR